MTTRVLITLGIGGAAAAVVLLSFPREREPAAPAGQVLSAPVAGLLDQRATRPAGAEHESPGAQAPAVHRDSRFAAPLGHPPTNSDSGESSLEGSAQDPALQALAQPPVDWELLRVAEEDLTVERGATPTVVGVAATSADAAELLEVAEVADWEQPAASDPGPSAPWADQMDYFLQRLSLLGANRIGETPPGATALLLEAYRRAPDPELKTDILNLSGGMDFDQSLATMYAEAMASTDQGLSAAGFYFASGHDEGLLTHAAQDAAHPHHLDAVTFLRQQVADDERSEPPVLLPTRLRDPQPSSEPPASNTP